MLADDFAQNPYPSYARLRAQRGGWLLENDNRIGSGGLWMFGRYDDVVAILRESQRISKEASRLVPVERQTPLDQAMINQDPPRHGALRRWAAPAFSPDRLSVLEREITRFVDSQLDQALSKRAFDLVGELAHPLPLFVVCRLIGVPPADTQQLRTWTDQVLRGFDSVAESPTVQEGQADAAAELIRYFTACLRRTDHPAGSLLDAAVHRAWRDGGPAFEATDAEILGACFLFLIAGYETTVNLITAGTHALLTHPEQLEVLKREPGLLDSAIEEMLRFESPIQRATFRVTREPIVIGGRELPADQHVSAVLGAANRDPDRFDDPDRFHIGRRPNRHVAFGLGAHRCLGEKLARLEARVMFSRLLQRGFPLEPGSDPPRWRPQTMFRALESLPVSCR